MLSLLYKEQSDFKAVKGHLQIAKTQDVVGRRGKAEDLE